MFFGGGRLNSFLGPPNGERRDRQDIRAKQIERSSEFCRPRCTFGTDMGSSEAIVEAVEALPTAGQRVLRESEPSTSTV